MNWYQVHHLDARARELADRHYSRQTIGAREFCPPGNKIVLIVPSDDFTSARALWVSHRPDPKANLVKPRADGFLYWNNPYFRNESNLRASDLILEALAITRYIWNDERPRDGFHSFVDPKHVQGVKVRGETVYGFTYLKAGFTRWPVLTKSRKLIRLVLSLPQLMAIEPLAPLKEMPRQLSLFDLVA